jgi:aspartate 1-decarboxylase
MRRFLRSKIHRATVTQAELDYEGSLSIDRTLMDLADIAPFEEIQVWNVTRGTRLTTYAIEAPRDSRVICVNGAGAHLVGVGDIIIIAAFQTAQGPEDATQPVVVLVDANNRSVAEQNPDVAGRKKKA